MPTEHPVKTSLLPSKSLCGAYCECINEMYVAALLSVQMDMLCLFRKNVQPISGTHSFAVNVF